MARTTQLGETGRVTADARHLDGSGSEDPEPSGRPRSRRRVALVVASAIAAVLVGFLAVTAATGLPGPGALERHRVGELRALADAIHDEAGDLRTPDDCWRTLPSKDGEVRDPTGPLRSIAEVDHLRSRVVVRVYANESGRIDATTRQAVRVRLDEVLGRDPRFSENMLLLEPSPDGWSPLVSCRLVTRGWVIGF